MLRRVGPDLTLNPFCLKQNPVHTDAGGETTSRDRFKGKRRTP
jgi:hypothetical protein